MMRFCNFPLRYGGRDDDYDPLYALTAEFLDERLGDMPQETITFEEYLTQHYSDTLRLMLHEGLADGQVPLGKTMDRVKYNYTASLAGCKIERIDTYLPETEVAGVFNIDVIVSTEISLYQDKSVYEGTGYSSQIEEQHHFYSRVKQWYRIKGIFDLLNRDFAIARTIRVYDPRENTKKDKLSPYLIKKMTETDYDEEAAELLRKARMEHLISHSGCVDAVAFAKALGFTVIEASLSKEHIIRGKLYLHAATVTVYESNGEKYNIEVPEGQWVIFYDPVACGTEARVGQTIIHECCHGYKHFLYFTLQNMHHEELSLLAAMDGFYRDEAEESYESKLEEMMNTETEYLSSFCKGENGISEVEEQASKITRHIQMPQEQTLLKIEDLLLKYAFLERLEALENTITELAAFYKTTFDEAKKRMVELGYTDAAGISVIVDGVRTPSYRTRDGVILADTTFSICKLDANWVCENNPVVRCLVEDEQVLYVEGHYCLNDNQYVYEDDDGWHLTEFARNNIDWCCLKFSISQLVQFPLFDKDCLHNDDMEYAASEIELIKVPVGLVWKRTANMKDLCKTLPRTFGVTLAAHRERMGLSQEKLSELLDIQSRQLQRWEADEVTPNQSQIAALGHMMNLRGEFTEDLMNKAGVPLDLNRPEGYAYFVVIYCMRSATLDEINKVMVMSKIKEIGLRARKKAS